MPALLQEQADRAWANILDRADEDTAEQLQALASTEPVAGQLSRVLGCSPFAAELARRKPGLLAELLAADFFQAPLAEGDMLSQLGDALRDEAVELGPALRQFRQRHMLRIIWRDFCRLADTLETVRDTSLLAEACIALALEHCQRALAVFQCEGDTGLRQQGGVAHRFQRVRQTAEVAPYNAQHMALAKLPQGRAQLHRFIPQCIAKLGEHVTLCQWRLEKVRSQQFGQQPGFATCEFCREGAAAEYPGELPGHGLRARQCLQLLCRVFIRPVENVGPGAIGLFLQECGQPVLSATHSAQGAQASRTGATRITSSIVVSPRATLAAPERRRVFMPSVMAASRRVAVSSCECICCCTRGLFTSTS